MDIPDAIEEKAVKIHWRQSTADPRKVVSIFEIDFGKTQLSPAEAADIGKEVVAILRVSLGVKLTLFK